MVGLWSDFPTNPRISNWSWIPANSRLGILVRKDAATRLGAAIPLCTNQLWIKPIGNIYSQYLFIAEEPFQLYHHKSESNINWTLFGIRKFVLWKAELLFSKKYVLSILFVCAIIRLNKNCKLYLQYLLCKSDVISRYVSCNPVPFLWL
jgi:hypothetical protein